VVERDKKLRYAFMLESSPIGGPAQKALVREGFERWREIGIGIPFEEISSISGADIRIGFVEDDGAWSYIGRDIRDIPGRSERTMNFGWDLTQDPRKSDVAVHEIGHTLGFPHEHQNPFSGIVWDEAEVIRVFRGLRIIGQKPRSGIISWTSCRRVMSKALNGTPTQSCTTPSRAA
jgi:hypothetical protein